MKNKGNERLKAVFVVLMLVSGFISATFTESAQAASRCQSSLVSSTDCELPYPDGGQILMPVSTCHNYSDVPGDGELTDPGYDYLLSVTIKNIGLLGSVNADTSLNIAATLAQDCNSFADSYILQGEVLGPDGSQYAITFGNGDFVAQDITFILKDYCFLHDNGLVSRCGFSHFAGSVSLPANAVSGNYGVQISVKPINPIYPAKQVVENFASILQVNGITAAPSMPSAPSATPTQTPAINYDVAKFSLSADSRGTLVGILDRNDVATYVANGAIGFLYKFRDEQTGMETTSPLQQIFAGNTYTETWTKLKAGSKYSVAIALEYPSGVGPWSEYVKASVPSPTILAKPIKKFIKAVSITCTKGNTKKIVVGPHPTCPLGFKKH